MTPLFVATGNRHKLVELRRMLADLPVRVVGPADLPAGQTFIGADETGSTFEENADLKAVHAAQFVGFLALADDSGLEVPALDGRPGVYSARYAGEDADDLANNAKLIAEAQAAGLHEPVARFRCVISVASPEGDVLARGAGACDGVLIAEPRGTSGFGYDPHFLVPELGKTFAEVTPAEKNARSHRARALAALQGPLVSLVARVAAGGSR